MRGRWFRSIRSLAAAIVVAVVAALLVVADVAPSGPRSAAAAVPTLDDGVGRQLVNLKSGFCVDVPSASTANGALFQQYRCNGTTAQSWLFHASAGGHHTLANVNSGKCFDVPSSSTTPGTQLQQYDCNVTDAQNWMATDFGGGIRIANKANGLCLGVQGGSMSESAQVVQTTCASDEAQVWAISKRAAGELDDGVARRLVNVNSGLCVDVPSASTADGALLQQYTCNGTGAQSWNAADVTLRYLQLTNATSAKCVDVPTSSTTSGTQLQQYTCNNSAAQAWRPIETANGYRLKNKGNSLCLGVLGGSTALSAQVVQVTCAVDAGQLWTVAKAPGTPTAVQASAGPGHATVTWTAPPVTPTDALVTGYVVTAAPGGQSVTVGAGATSGIVTGLTNGTAYTFTVKATNASGPGPASTPSSSVTPTATVPGVPAGVSASVGDAQATVSWTAPADNGGSPVTGYTVTSSPGNLTATTTGTSTAVTGLTNGTAYTFTVKATNNVGTGPPSSPSAAVTPLGPAGAPGGVTATPGNGQATVSWTAPGNTGGSPVTGYTVTASPGGATVTSSSTSATVTGLTNGTAYTFTVRATTAAGAGAVSAASAAVVPSSPATTPGAPTGVTGTRGNGQATVSWTAPGNTGGSPVTGYTVTASPGGQTVTVTGTSATVTGLTNGTAYTFTVRATNGFGQGAASVPSAAVTPATVPGAPTQVAAVRGDAQATVTWTAPAGTGGSPVTGYTVTSNPGGLTVTSTSTTATVTGLTNGTPYTFTVTATNAVGSSTASTASAPVTPMSPPGPPQNVTAIAGNGQATVSWAAPSAQDAPQITGYTVASDPGGLVVSAPAGQTSRTVTGLTNGQAYRFTVVATTASGATAPSAPSAWVTPSTVPGAVRQLIVTPRSGSVELAWQAPASDGGAPITGYAVAATGVGTVNVTATSATVTGLTNGTAYGFTVTASNIRGAGPGTAAPVATPRPAPGPPLAVTAEAGDGQVRVLWEPPADPGGGSLTGYVATAAPGGATVAVAGTQTEALFTSLINGTTYTFTVRAQNAFGTGTASAASTPVTPVILPAPPTAVTAVAGNAQATVSWTAPQNNGAGPIAGYEIVGNGRVVTVAGTVTTAVVTGLRNGVPHVFTVTARTAAGRSLASVPSAAVTPAAAPGVPRQVVAVPGTTDAAVTWAEPAETGGQISSYTVTASPGGQSATVPGTRQATTVTGLSRGQTYTFTVRATTSGGVSAPSTPSAPVTLAAPPSAPAAPAATAGDHRAHLSWTAPASNGGSALTTYTITASPGGISTVVAATSTQADVLGLTNGTSYTFSVAATNAAGTGPESAASTAVIPTGSPEAPTGVTAVAGTGQATVTWTAPLNGGSAITGYTVTSSPGGLTATATATTATVTGLTNGTSYTFTVTATSTLGTGPSSAPTAAVTPSGTPGAPTAVTAVRGDGQAVVAWTAPAASGGTPITSYTVTSSPGGLTATATATTATVTGLTNGTSYTFTVRAKNSAITGPASAASAAVVPAGVPGVPRAPTATSVDGQAQVSWLAPTGNGGSAVTSYRVTITPGGLVTTVTGTSATVTGLTNGTTYTVVVAAGNIVGTGPPTAPVTVTPARLPGAPTQVTALARTTKAVVSWTAPSDTGSAALTGYTVTSSPGNLTATVVGTATTATVTGLTNGTTYTFTVKATNPAGQSAASAASTPVTPVAAPGAPTTVTAVRGTTGNVQLSWIPPASTGGGPLTEYWVKITPSNQQFELPATHTSANFTGLARGTSYTFEVTAVNASGGPGPGSAASNAVIPASAPAAPTQAQVGAGNTMAVFAWQAPADTGGIAITSYTATAVPVGGCSGACPSVTVDGAKRSATLTGLVTGTAYTFTLYASNAIGGGAVWSTDRTVTPGAAPGPPAALQAWPRDGKALLRWTAPAHTGDTPISSYIVTAQPGGHTHNVSGSVLSVEFPGLANNTAYTFTVAAVNAAGTGLASPRTGNVTPGIVPGAPGGVVAMAGDGAVALSWMPPAVTGTSPITWYAMVEVKSGRTLYANGTQLGGLFTGLTNGQPYSFQIHAYNNTGYSGASAPTDPARPTLPQVPGRPLITSTDPGDGTVNVRWSPPDLGAASVTQYRVSATPGGTVVQVPGSALEATVSGLANGTDHTFTVTAVNAVGTGPASVASPPIAPHGPGAPKEPLILSAVAGAGVIDVTWAAAEDPDAPTTGYTLTAQPGNVRVTLDAGESSGQLTGLTNGVDYTVSLTARNNQGTSPAAVRTGVRPLAHRAPLPPADLSVSVPADGQLRVEWTPPQDQGTEDITSYTVALVPGGQTRSVTDCTAPPCGLTWNGLSTSAAYGFTVTAVSPDGASLPSTQSKPVTPTVELLQDPVELSPAAEASLTDVHADGTLVFTGAPPEVAALDSGDYFILRPTQHKPHGYVGRVLSRAENGNKQIVRTEQKSVRDVVGEGEFAGQATLGAQNVLTYTAPAAGVRLLGGGGGRATLRGPGSHQVDPLVLEIDHDFGGGARASGVISVTPLLNWDYKLGANPRGRVGAKAVISGSLRLTANAAWGPREKNIWLGHWTLMSRIVVIGGVPTLITVELEPTLELSGQASGALNLNVRPNIVVGAEAEGKLFGKPTFTPIYQNNSRMIDPLIQGNASAELGVRMEIGVRIDALAALEIVPTPYIRATADINADPWWQVRAGARIQGCADLLTVFEICTPEDWLDFGFTVAAAEGPFEGMKIVPGVVTTVLGANVQFDDVPVNAPDGPVTWSVLRGPGAVTQTGLYNSAVAGDAVVQVVRAGGDPIDHPRAQAIVHVGAQRPGPPKDVKAAPGPSSAIVSWQPDDGVVQGVTGFAISTTPATTTVYVEASDRSVRLRGLTPGRPYNVQVHALSGAGMSDASGGATVIPTEGLALDGDAENIAVDAAGNPDNTGFAGRGRPYLSGDGRYAFFMTLASSNLMPPEVYQPGSDAVYMLRKNLETKEIELASVGPDGHTPVTPLQGGGKGQVVSTDGDRFAYLAFSTGTSVPGPDGSDTYVIVHDLAEDSVWVAASGFKSEARTSGPYTTVAAMSGDGNVVLYEHQEQDADSTLSRLVRATRAGGPTTVVEYLDEEHGSGDTFWRTSWTDGELSGDGSTVLYDGYDAPTNQFGLLSWKDGTAKIVALGHSTWTRMSFDGSTVAYSGYTEDVDNAMIIRKVTLPKEDPGTVFLEQCAVPTGLSADGRYVAFGECASNQQPVTGVYDAFGGTSVISSRNIGAISHDATKTLSTRSDVVTGGGGVWLQNYNPDTPGTTECNVPDYGYIGQYERRTGIRILLCNDEEHPLAFGKTNPDEGIKPPGWPEKNIPPALQVPASWPDDNRKGIFHRGHLYAAVLGGSNSDDRNFVTQLGWSNSVLQNSLELSLRDGLKAQNIGKVYYYVTPVYSDQPSTLPNPTPEAVGPNGWSGALPSIRYAMPNKIHIVAVSTTGLVLDACVPNTNDNGAQITYDAPCLA